MFHCRAKKYFLLILILSSAAWGQFGGGQGTAESPFLIFTGEHFVNIGKNPQYWGSHFHLMNDIDLSGHADNRYQVIGVSLDEPFQGYFDGRGHEIRHFRKSTSDFFYTGLFGVVLGRRAQICNVGLIEPEVHQSFGVWTGAIVGLLYGSLENCYVERGSVSGFANVGGLVGENFHGSIVHCYSTASVSHTANGGGLVGINSGDIEECFASGSVRGNEKVGGLVGWNDPEGRICRSFSTGSVVATVQGAGGLAGLNDGEIYASYCTSSVGAAKFVGGFVGSNMTGQVWNSFWDKQASGQATSSAGEGLTTAQMDSRQSYINRGWDFQEQWRICDGLSTPRLRAILPPASDFGCPDGVDMKDLLFLSKGWAQPRFRADVGPDDGDGDVNYVDWSVFHQAWQTTLGDDAYNELCDLAPLGGNGMIDFADLYQLIIRWGGRGAEGGDISPKQYGDEFVDYADFAVLARQWGH